jgi:PAS domain S-box-containing protein
MSEQKPAAISRLDSIRTRLILAFLLIVLLPMAVISAVVAISGTEGAQMQLAAQLDMAASFKESAINTWTATLKNELGDALLGENTLPYINEIIMKPIDSHEHRIARNALIGRFRKMTAQTQRFKALFLMDRQGRVVLSTDRGQEGEVYSGKDFFQRGLKRSSVCPSSINGMTMVASRPLIGKGGRVVGVLTGQARLGPLNEIMSSPIGLGKTGKTYLVGNDHILLTALNTDTPGIRVQSNGIQAVLEDQAKSFSTYKDFRGMRVIGAYRYLPELGVALLAEQDQAESSQAMYVLLAVNASVALAAVIIAAFASVSVTRSIAVPLAELSETAARIAAGNLELTADVQRKDEIGALAQTFNFMTDKLKQTMEGLRASEGKYRGIFANALEGIFQTTFDGRMFSANPAMARILAYDSPDDMLNSLTDIRHQLYCYPEERDLVLSILREQGTVLGYECQFFRKDKQPIWISISAAIVRDDAGKPLFIEGLITDIRERKQTEELLARKTAELERSNKELEQFASVASHDLKAPLATIGGFSQVLYERYNDKLDEKGQRALFHIIKGTLRMELLIQDLLAYSRVTTGGQSFSLIHCNTVIDMALGNLRAATEQNDAVITVDDLPDVHGDEMQFVQLFQNLIGNAIQYRSEQPPRIHVSAKRLDDPALHSALRIPHSAMEPGWLFSVTDNGIGIAPVHFEKIFEIFRRLHSNDKYPGTGIGLAICKKIVERHGGRIWVESEPGKGSTFYFTVPDRLA